MIISRNFPKNGIQRNALFNPLRKYQWNHWMNNILKICKCLPNGIPKVEKGRISSSILRGIPSRFSRGSIGDFSEKKSCELVEFFGEYPVGISDNPENGRKRMEILVKPLKCFLVELLPKQW